SKGGIFSDKGFDPKEVLAFKEKTGSVVGFPGTKPVSNEAVLELEVDILAPCALEGVLTSENAPRVKAKIIGEGANGPTTPEAGEDDIRRRASSRCSGSASPFTLQRKNAASPMCGPSTFIVSRCGTFPTKSMSAFSSSHAERVQNRWRKSFARNVNPMRPGVFAS